MVDEVFGAAVRTSHSTEIHFSDEGEEHIDFLVRALLRERWGTATLVARPIQLCEPTVSIMEIRRNDPRLFGAVSFSFHRVLGITTLAFQLDPLGSIMRTAAFVDPGRVVPYLFWNEFIDFGDEKATVDSGVVYSRQSHYPLDVPRCVIVNCK